MPTPCRGPGGVAASDAAFPTTHGKSKYQGTVAKTVWDSPSYLIRDDRFMITKKVPKVQVKQIKIAWQKRHPMLV